MDPNMVAGQNLHSLTSSPEFVHQLFQQLKEDIATLKEQQKPNLETTTVSWQTVSPEARLVHFLTSSPEVQQLLFVETHSSM